MSALTESFPDTCDFRSFINSELRLRFLDQEVAFFNPEDFSRIDVNTLSTPAIEAIGLKLGGVSVQAYRKQKIGNFPANWHRTDVTLLRVDSEDGSIPEPRRNHGKLSMASTRKGELLAVGHTGIYQAYYYAAKQGEETANGVPSLEMVVGVPEVIGDTGHRQTRNLIAVDTGYVVAHWLASVIRNRDAIVFNAVDISDPSPHLRVIA
jgi:hypothetical protein